MAAQGLEAEAEAPDCKFSNLRKPYWRSATWNSRSAPVSPKLGNDATPAAGEGKAEHRVPVLERQTSKARASLPPLQPLSIARRSLDEWPKAALDDMDTTDCPSPSMSGRRRIKTGPDIKIDLSSVPRGPLDSNDIQRKRDKFAFFDKECSRVSNSHIYLGSDAVAKNREMLKANRITHVLNCVGFVCPEYFKNDFVYKTLWLQDSPGEDITSLLYDVFDYFEEVKEQGGRVFVHCCQGVSRSTSLVIAYMMWHGRLSFDDAFQDVKASRGVTNPNMGFACQLLQCQKRVHAAPMSPNSVLRMYRLAPHSPYDPLHLVPKAVNNPGAGSLDSRGAFVIHVPLAIYVWLGHHCDHKIADAARVAACQVVRYERAQGPMHIIREGHESTEFWDSLSIYADPVDEADSMNEIGKEKISLPDRRKRAGQTQVDKVRNIEIGKREVAAYSSDFELFQRAKQGGVVPPVPSTALGISPVPTRIPAREDGWSMLRKKFLSGQLVTPKEMGSSDGNSLSPNPSASSSSPVFSPFSVTSSSSGNAGSDSPFGSPLSHLSISSPNTPVFYTPCASQSVFTIDRYQLSPRVGGSQAKSPLKISYHPPLLASMKPSVLLAERRAAAAGAATAPPQLVQEMDLPMTVTDQESTDEIDACRNDGFRFVADGGICNESAKEDPDQIMHETGILWDSHQIPVEEMDVVDEQHSPLANLEFGHPVLYTWPEFKRVSVFNADHLNSKAVILCIAPEQLVEGKNVLYIWVGRKFEEQICDEDKDWNTVGRQFLEHMKCCNNVVVRVAREGNEPEEFWRSINFSL